MPAETSCSVRGPDCRKISKRTLCVECGLATCLACSKIQKGRRVCLDCLANHHEATNGDPYIDGILRRTIGGAI